MRLWMITATLTAASFTPTVVNTGWAQEQEHAPLLNSIGRFFGVGYSAGYHARYDTRLGIKHTPPGQNVVPSPYHRNAYTIPAASHMPFVHNSVQGAPIGPNAKQGATVRSGNTATEPSAETIPAVPRKPSVPPPSWLRPFLKPDGTTLEPNSNKPDAPSPSDRRGVKTTPSATGETTGLFIESDPSDLILDNSVLGP